MKSRGPSRSKPPRSFQQRALVRHHHYHLEDGFEQPPLTFRQTVVPVRQQRALNTLCVHVHLAVGRGEALPRAHALLGVLGEAKTAAPPMPWDLGKLLGWPLKKYEGAGEWLKAIPWTWEYGPQAASARNLSLQPVSGSGTHARMVVPRPGAVSRSSSPPSESTRSFKLENRRVQALGMSVDVFAQLDQSFPLHGAANMAPRPPPGCRGPEADQQEGDREAKPDGLPKQGKH